jgi:hypothetical protein
MQLETPTPLISGALQFPPIPKGGLGRVVKVRVIALKESCIPLASPSFLMSPRTQGGIRGVGTLIKFSPHPREFSRK